ncbi:MAG: patatin-like phospholipase family protein [Symploca sp. SIO2G7]|nr:patatin-like phospholipase family protein [Symploca sp. SIO2G7]
MKFRILSLDGGGIRGVVSATILKEIEEVVKEKENGKALHEYFDLIAGTSTGSILAAGIACQKNAEEMVQLYEKRGKDIFLKQVRQKRKATLNPLKIGSFKPITFGLQVLKSYALYPHESKNQGLANVLKQELKHKKLEKCPQIGEIKETQLLILAYDVLSRNTTWFANDDPTEWYYDTEIWKICTASASAPTFFPPYKLPYSKDIILPHIDGGVAANNPELAAIAHALSMKTDNSNPKIEEIAVLSIGTGKTTSPYKYEEVKKWGLLNWATKIPDIFLDPGAENANYITQRIFLGMERKNYLRLNFDLNELSTSDKQPGKRRKSQDNSYNKYIEKAKQQQKHISEKIDDSNICPDLIEAAECYLDCGEVEYGSQREIIPVRSAIRQFIDSHPVEDRSYSPLGLAE